MRPGHSSPKVSPTDCDQWRIFPPVSILSSKSSIQCVFSQGCERTAATMSQTQKWEWLGPFSLCAKSTSMKWFSWAPLVPIFFGCLPMIPKGQEAKLGLGAPLAYLMAVTILQWQAKGKADGKIGNAAASKIRRESNRWLVGAWI